MIKSQELTRTFVATTGILRRKKKEIPAVRGVSFQVGKGELFGLLGPNGAGKTTTVKMLTTLLIPTAGNAEVAGFDVVEQPTEVQRRIGVINNGRIVAMDTPSGLKSHVKDLSVVELELYGAPNEIVDTIRRLPGIDAATLEERDQRQSLLVQTSRGSEAVPEILATLTEYRVGRVMVREPTLEDAYVRLVSVPEEVE